MALGKKKYKQSFMGRLFGKIALKEMMKDEPIKKNLPTVPSFKIKEHVDFSEEKKKWIEGRIEALEDDSRKQRIEPGQLR